MDKTALILTILATALVAPAPAGGAAAAGLLRDGFALTGIEGRLSEHAETASERYIRFGHDRAWLFELGADVNDLTNVVKAGTKLQLLPSTSLEKLIADARLRPGDTYRLWGRVTKYRGANYIFPELFLPVVEVAPPEPGESKEPNEPVQPHVVEEPAAPSEPNGPQNRQEPNAPPAKASTGPVEPAPLQARQVRKLLAEPNGVLEVPPEVLQKIKNKKIYLPRKIPPKPEPQQAEQNQPQPQKLVQAPAATGGKAPAPAKEAQGGPEQQKKAGSQQADRPKPPRPPQAKLDSVLADRTAVLVRQKNGRPLFVLDAYGLSVQDVAFEPLPNEVLELTETREKAELNQVRFKIAGIRTEFKGRQYLLLQKATRVYSHGNFGW